DRTARNDDRLLCLDTPGLRIREHAARVDVDGLCLLCMSDADDGGHRDDRGKEHAQDHGAVPVMEVDGGAHHTIPAALRPPPRPGACILTPHLWAPVTFPATGTATPRTDALGAHAAAASSSPESGRTRQGLEE